MRIAIIADFDVMGGTRTYFELLAGMLHREGHELVGLVPSAAEDDDFFDQIMRNKFRAWCTFPSRRGFFSTRQPFAAFWEWKRLLPFILRYKPQVLFFTHGTPGHWLSCLLLPLPSVHVLHSCVLSNKPPECWILHLFLRRLGRKRCLCTVSHFAAGLINNAWNVPTTVIYNPASYSFAGHFDVRPGCTRIITLGHVVDYKNPYTWVCVAHRVLARHPNVSFIWYGDGPLLERMRNLSKGLDGVSFPGRITRLQNPFKDGAVYFQPSDLESHGIAVVEAMCNGLPCVVSCAGGLPESVQHGFNGFVLSPDDASGMADAICCLLEDSDMRNDFGNAGRILAQEKFSLEHWEKEILALINNVARS
ncbi:glycosyltransferase family 4 protein [Desulfomicrobium salsuginis]